MGKRKVGALEKVEADLPNLQHKIRRDAPSYQDEFEKQYKQYKSQREIFLSAPSSATDTGIISLKDLINFVAHVADSYRELTKDYPDELIEILKLHHKELEPELRETIVTSLVLLRNKDVISSSKLLKEALLPVLTVTSSKSLRTLLLQKILSDLRSSNAKTVHHQLNRAIQRELRELVESDRESTRGLWAVKIIRELWKRQIWTDTPTVEIMKEAALADNIKVVVGAVRFFLGGDREREELAEESDDAETIDIRKVKHQVGINKKTKKNNKVLESAIEKIKRKEKKKNQPHMLNFSAFHLLNDPQSFAETLFQKHLQNTKSILNLEQKLQVLQLVSRLVGLHKLIILPFYSYFIKFLTPRQPSVTSFLASLAQATHSLVPPETLEPLVRKVANEFVSEAAASEVAAAGLNAIREICTRQHLAIDDTLLQDLVMYKKSKDKGVMMAAKGLLSLYREKDAGMLKPRDRGKDAAIGLRTGERKEKRFGEEAIGEIQGLELLEAWKKEERQRKRDEKGLGSDDEDSEEEQEDDGAWEVGSNNSSDSGGWINVVSDEDIEISDSDDGQPKAKRAKTATTPRVDDDEKENEAQKSQELEKKISTLATTRILTPADLVKLQELRLEASVNKALPASQRKRLAQQAAQQRNRHADDPLTQEDIEAAAKLSKKLTKEEKIVMAKDGKGERNEHKSTKAIRQARKNAEGKSSTNREKARKKNFLMTLGKAKSKGKQSLVERGRVLKADKDRRKRGGRRGNNG
ncbi:MAG: Severe Depolymerization of Actin [Stictis urceolatum]|nr:Severe Depolymerization of Actin [Stictis urceolata]